MKPCYCFLLCTTAMLFSLSSYSQDIEKINFDTKDSDNGYYLAIRPQSKNIKGVLVLLTSFIPPEYLLSETKLHNVAYANDLLMVFVYTKLKLYADQPTVQRLDVIMKDIAARFKADTAKFAVAGYDEAGNIALRFTELTYEKPSQHPVQPKAVMGIDANVDLFALWKWSEGQIKKNYYQGSVGDAHYYIDTMTKDNGTIEAHPENYERLTPFHSDKETPGNEQFLKTVPVRLYYDTDIDWQLKNRRNSYNDTKMPAASELIKRLLLMGNTEASFMSSARPGLRSNGMRHPNSLSIVEESECIQWIKKSLHIFNPQTFVPPYKLPTLPGWDTELFELPPDFAEGFTYKGVEDIRFTGGWGDSTSTDYWSYAYLWWLDGNVSIDAVNLQTNLTKYYAGLVGRNIEPRHIPSSKIVPTVAAVKKIKTVDNDLATFSGDVHMLDYMMQKPIVLNLVIHVFNCGVPNHTAVFVEVSPSVASHKVWQQFAQIREGFKCSEGK